MDLAVIKKNKTPSALNTKKVIFYKTLCSKQNKFIQTVLTIFLLVISANNYSYSQYKSSFEEKILERYKDSLPEIYDLLNTVNYDDKIHVEGRNKLKAFVSKLKDKRIQNKSLKKQIQTIYKSTHSEFFNKYKENAYFNDIFKNGSYNCVTASALYTIILDEFDINYSIKETPTHVYLIADTLGLQTLIESTLPGTGIISYNDKYKKDFVTYLNENKIISDSEFQQSTTESLFNNYATKDKAISKYELAAIQYYNKGISLFNEEKFSGAAESFKKASIIYPSNTIQFMLFASLQNALINDFNTKEFDGKLFGKIINSGNTDKSLLQLSENYFNDVSTELCVQSPDIDRYKNFYEELLQTCPKENLPNFVLSKYHYSLAYNYSINSNYSKALTEIELAYKHDNNNLLIKELANHIGVKQLFIENNYKNQIDNMEHYFEVLPFLLKNSMYQSQYTYYFMKVISEAITYDKPNEGIEYYKKYLSALSKYDLIHYNEEHIGIGFGAVAYHYAQNNNFKKASEVVEQGIDLVPSSNMLNKVKNQLKLRKQYIQEQKKYQNRETDSYTYESPSEKLKNELYKYFPGNWKAETIVIEDMEQTLTKKETFEFIASKNKNCIYIHDGKTEKGRWAYRPISRCIYFVPNNNKDNYKVFKLKEISANKLVILPFKDQKKPSPYKYVLKLK